MLLKDYFKVIREFKRRKKRQNIFNIKKRWKMSRKSLLYQLNHSRYCRIRQKNTSQYTVQKDTSKKWKTWELNKKRSKSEKKSWRGKNKLKKIFRLHSTSFIRLMLNWIFMNFIKNMITKSKFTSRRKDKINWWPKTKIHFLLI
jgi:hypothetical protein